MSVFRKILFWLHLGAGMAAGLVIAVMSATGVVLAFEKELIAWSEHDLRTVTAAAESVPLPLDDLLSTVRVSHPEIRVSAVTLYSDRSTAVQVSAGREGTYWVNPYTAVVRATEKSKMRAFLKGAEDLHRWLALQGERRVFGKTITGAATLAFLFLSISGLWLWFPRGWSRRAFRPRLWFTRSAGAAAREWNWHHVAGFWSAPVLIVLTLTGLVLSYRWASDAVFRLAGEEPPQLNRGAPPTSAGQSRTESSRKTNPGVSGTSYVAITERVKSQFPHWESLSIRVEGGDRPVTVAVRSPGEGPSFAATMLTFDRRSGELLKTEPFSRLSAGRKARSWIRLLHTGEALGFAGQLTAALACSAGVVLAWSGLSLALRRFARRGRAAAEES